MSTVVLPRATKNAGLSSSTWNRGRAKANIHSTARCSQATASSRMIARLGELDSAGASVPAAPGGVRADLPRGGDAIRAASKTKARG